MLGMLGRPLAHYLLAPTSNKYLKSKHNRRRNPPWGRAMVNNRYTNCAVCLTPVPANEGVAVQDEGDQAPSYATGQMQPKWKVFHIEPCAPKEVADRIKNDIAVSKTVTLELSDDSPGNVEIVLPISPNAKCKKCNTPLYEHKPLDKDHRFESSDEVRLPGDLWYSFRETLEKVGGKLGGRHGKYYYPYLLGFKKIAAFLEAAATIGLSVKVPLEVSLKSKELAASQRAQARDISEQLAYLQHGGKKLRDYQIQGAQWLAAGCNRLLADEQGLGKTVQVSVALDVNAPVLIVGPIAVMQNWQREITHWRPDRDPHKVILVSKTSFDKGPNDVFKQSKNFVWPKPGETVITAYSRIPDLDPEAVHKLISENKIAPGIILISDEGQELKGKFSASREEQEAQDEDGGPNEGAGTIVGTKVVGTQRAYKFQMLSGIVRSTGGCVWILTGTPLSNQGDELWRVLERGGLETDAFDTWDNYVRIMSPEQGKRGKGGKGPKYDWKHVHPDEEAVTAGIKKVMLRREKQDWLPELLPKNYQVFPVELSAEYMESVNRELDRLGIDVEDIESLLAEGKIKFEELARVRGILAKAKIPALEALVDSYGNEPLLVFAAHTEPLEELVRRENAKGKRWGLITGKNVRTRQPIIDAFQNGDLDGVAIGIKAAGAGINLVRTKKALAAGKPQAHTSIFVDLQYNPSQNEQAEDRIHRIGQTEQVTIVQMMANHLLDQRLWTILGDKREMIQKVVKNARIMPGQAIPGMTFTPIIPVDSYTPPLFQPEFVRGPDDPAASRARILADMERWRVLKRLPTQKQLQDTTRRHALTATDEWIVRSLEMLSDLDQDRALELNGMGFNKGDSQSGHRMAYLALHTGLTEEEWSDAFNMLQKYKRNQIGEPGGEKPKARAKVRGSARVIRRGAGAPIEAPQLTHTAPTPSSGSIADHVFRGKRGRTTNGDEGLRKCVICEQPRNTHQFQQAEAAPIQVAIPAPTPSRQRGSVRVLPAQVERPASGVVSSSAIPHTFKKIEGGRGRAKPDAICATCGVPKHSHRDDAVALPRAAAQAQVRVVPANVIGQAEPRQRYESYVDLPGLRPADTKHKFEAGKRGRPALDLPCVVCGIPWSDHPAVNPHSWNPCPMNPYKRTRNNPYGAVG